MSEKQTELEEITENLQAARNALARYLAENPQVQKRSELWDAALAINKAIGHLGFVQFFHQEPDDSIDAAPPSESLVDITPRS